MNQISDEELIRRVQSGDILAFETLIKRHQARLVHVLYRITYNEKLAEEAAQDAFFSVYTHIETIDTSKKFSSFLYAVGRNCAISLLRKEKGKLVSLDTVENRESDGVSLLEDIVSKEERGHIREALRSLRSVHQRVIEMHYFDELSYQAIAGKLKLPVNTVRTHLRRSKLALRKLLYETD